MSDSPLSSRPGDDGFQGFTMQIFDNCIEFMLFVIDEGTKQNTPLPSLEDIRTAALQFCEELTKDYIWQRDSFKLELKDHGGTDLFF